VIEDMAEPFHMPNFIVPATISICESCHTAALGRTDDPISDSRMPLSIGYAHIKSFEKLNLKPLLPGMSAYAAETV
jgi:hypothetical protein